MEEGGGAELFLEDFGQKVDLTRRIREVLANYPEGTTVLKELIQNADDAGASKLCFCLDQRSHATETLLDARLAQWQGPALLSFNDAVFTEDDFASISTIGDSHKPRQTGKTGRFGIGFNSVYHLTDLPSFVSGKYVVFFDPQRKFLPNVNSSNPGKRIDFVNSSALSLYEDQFQPYLVFGCDMKNAFSGTLFRFPLRNVDQAADSKLSRQSYTVEDIDLLFRQLYREAVLSLLFLKNISKLEMYIWHTDGQAPELMYSCYVKLPGSETVCQRKSLLKMSSLKQEADPVVDSFLLDFVSEAFEVTRAKEKVVSSYIIVQKISSLSGRLGTIVNHAEKEYGLHLLPWASVAACTSQVSEQDCVTVQDCVRRDGHAFCSLPLPIQTGLAVHVNGFFELSSNRRDIWHGADMDRAGKLRSEWNLCLLQDVVVPAFIELLLEASKVLGPSEFYYALWPCGPFKEPWLTLVKKFYRDIATVPSLYSCVDGGRWLRLADAYIYDAHFAKGKDIGSALICLGMPIVTLQKLLLETFISYCDPSVLNIVCPGTVRRMLQKSKSKVLDKEHALLLLEYCLDDLVDEEVAEAASSLSIIPLANGDYGSLQEKSKGVLYFICKNSENTLLRNLSDRVVDNELPPNVFNRLLNIASTRKTNLVLFNYTNLVQLLPLILPADWKHKEVVEWFPSTSDVHPTESWFENLWSYLNVHCDDISKFLEWPLLPITGGKLSKASRNSKILDGKVLEDSLKEILLKLGCKIFNPIFQVDHPQLHLYVSKPTAPAVLDAIYDVASQLGAQVEGLFSNVSCNEKQELRHYLLNQKWYAEHGGRQGLMTRWHVSICKKLPIFEAYSDVIDDETSIFTVLGSSEKFLVPLPMHRNLIGSDFLRSCSSVEDELLQRFYGVERMGRPAFYKQRVFLRIAEISPPILENVMIMILQELPQLCMQDTSFKDLLKNLDFVPTSSGRLRSPSALYDPRNEELYNLLEGHDCFPCGRFEEPVILDVLQQMGLRTTVSPETILQSAKQIECLMHQDPVKAHPRGKVLLSYLDVNINKWLPQPTGEGNNSVNKLFTRVATAFQLNEANRSVDLNKFWNDLRMICWCPALVDPPYPLLPWPTVYTTVAPPKLVRLSHDIWLVSASMRILDGECRSDALSQHLGWSASPGGSIIAGQLLELGKNHEVVMDTTFRQALALSMPRMYSLLTNMIGTDEMTVVKAILEGSRWVWVGDGFAKVDEVVLNGPLHLAPYVRVIPVDLAVFKDLFLDLGVRDILSPTDLAHVLSKMAMKKSGSPLDANELRAAVLIVQSLADAHFHDSQLVSFIPDTASILTPAKDLTYNDAPWLSKSDDLVKTGLASTSLEGNRRIPKFVHGNISNEVAEKLGVCSLRRLLLAESADSLKWGLHGAAEAFGQHEALTTRLKHIVEMYADGPGILFELVQNADDAGASEVCFLLDKTHYGTSSLLSPQMADWQGPALYCYNNSVFTAHDLYAISRIGQDSKLEKPFAIGRFGLGFNSVYHFTDIPAFVSGDNIVIFDPHAGNLPGITPSHPGLRISFVGKGVLEQFPDQFTPFLHFGCDLRSSFPGTLFRFPLRTPNVASSSQIKTESYGPENVLSLFSSFYSIAAEALLFLRKVSIIKIYVKEGASHEMVLVHRISRQPVNVTDNQSVSTKLMLDFVHGSQRSGISKKQFYQRLENLSDADLPWSCRKVLVSSADVAERLDLWMVSECLGGGQARNKSVSLASRGRSFIPWASVAAKIQHEMVDKTSTDTSTSDCIASSSSCDFEVTIQGRAFCFLPLPINTGLPIHVNAYFELSSNRRDIWFGDDMTGGGKLRSDWNNFLLEDAAAPAYARLLASIATDMGSCSAYYKLWPSETLRKPWASLMQKVYMSMSNLDLCVLFTKARGGQWISPNKAVFPDYSFPEATELGNVLSEAGLFLVDAPKPVVDRFQEFCTTLRYLTPQLLRDLLIRQRRGFKRRDTMLMNLKYCLYDLDENLRIEILEGLPLVPLANGIFTSFTRYKQGEDLYITSQIEYDLLKDAVPYLLVDRSIEEQVFSKLIKVASNGGSNLLQLTPEVFEQLMPKIFPVGWQERKAVLWASHQRHPSLEWLSLFWTYINSSCADLSIFSRWPILPTTDGHLLQLFKNSNVIKDEGWSENILSLLQKTGCFLLRGDVAITHPDLGEYVQNATAIGILNALLAAAGDLASLNTLFRGLSEGELRELRTFLCQSKWFTTGEMDAEHIVILKSLPIYETYGIRSFVSLTESDKWLKPEAVVDELITEKFIYTSSEREFTILNDYLGVKMPTKRDFYKENMVSLFSKFSAQPNVILKVVEELKVLIEDDSILRDDLAEEPFVLTSRGSRQKPARLYDPRIKEIQSLLHQDEYLPANEFRVPEILDFLVLLGLQNTLDVQVVLHTARSVAMLYEEGHEEDALHRARSLLAIINTIEFKETVPTETSVCDIGLSEGTEYETPDLSEGHVKTDTGSLFGAISIICGQPHEDFWNELANTRWCPVLVSSLEPGLPWPKNIKGLIAPPKMVRPKSQMWLVSSSMRILDGDCCSSFLQGKLGWLEPPNAGVLATQLIELSKTYAYLKFRSDGAQMTYLNSILQKEIPLLYSMMQNYVGTDDFVVIQSLLDGCQWIWIGDNFVSSKDLALDSPAKFQPYLYAVTSELSPFRGLLTSLGVRMTFGIADYAHVLQRLKVDMRDAPLTPEQVSFVLRVLEVVADILADQVDSDEILGSILAPDTFGVLRPVGELFYNDVPWIDRNSVEIHPFVHSCINNDLAEKLGAKSLRCISFIDQELTTDITCLDYAKISEILGSYGNEDFLLFDLLELADRCQAKKLHILYDRQEYPRQSLLQPNLGDYQGPSLVVVFEGAVLSMEDTCSLHHTPPWKVRGQTITYGSGLLSCYQLCDLQFIVSDGFLYLFDPMGLIFSSSLKRGDLPSSQIASAKMYSLRGTDLATRFRDQFLPLSVDKKLSCTTANSTIIRIPLKYKLKDCGLELCDQKIKEIFNKFKSHSSSIMLFLTSVKQVHLSVLESGGLSPRNDYCISVDPMASTVHSIFPEKKWRKFQISNLFSSSHAATKMLAMDVCRISDDTTHIDRWLMSITLGSGQTRNMALDRRFMAYNLVPIAGVAANISCNGKFQSMNFESCILSPLPLTYAINLPVSIFGSFLLCHHKGRHLFKNQNPVTSLQSKSYSDHQLIESWNRELMSCVRDSYVELLVELQRLRKNPLTSHFDSTISKFISELFRSSPDRIYSFWPRSKPLKSLYYGTDQSEELQSSLETRKAEFECLVEKVIKPVYSRLVELPVWQLYGGEVVKAEDGMFLSTPEAEMSYHSPPATVCSFIKERYPVFSVPSELVSEIQAIGVAVKEITPKMVRSLLKASPTSIVLRSVETHIDILEYCFSDLKLQEPPVSNTSTVPVDNRDSMPHVNASQRQLQVGTNTARIRASQFSYSTGNVRTGAHRNQTNSVDSGGDPLEFVSSVGRALLDFGRGVVEDIGMGSRSSTQVDNFVSSGTHDDTSAHLAYIAAEIKNLPCPTATKHLFRIGATDMWIGNREQQILMLPLAVKFLHPECFDRSAFTTLFENVALQKLLRMQTFSPQLLSTHMKSILSSQWVSYINDNASSPWILWEYSSLIKGPSLEWICLFWKNMNGSVEELRLFSDWPLVPAIVSSPVLCRVKHRQLVFLPPGIELLTADTEQVRNLDETKKQVNDAFEKMNSRYPWLLLFLNRCNVPIYDSGFLDCGALNCCLPALGKTLAQVVISKLLTAKQTGYFSPEARNFTSTDCDNLFELIQSDFSPSPFLVPTYTTEELDMLKSLPIYKTVTGTYRSVNGHDCCVISPNAFFQPADERCLFRFSVANAGVLYHVLGVPELHNEEILVKFALPDFELKSERDRECILNYIALNWENLQFQDTVVNTLKNTRFVNCGGHDNNSTLFKPQDLLDPNDTLLNSVFTLDGHRFPGGRFATEGWLRILRKVGLRTSSEPEMLVECARRVEVLGHDTVTNSGGFDAFDASDFSSKNELSTGVWLLATSVTEAILKQFPLIYGSPLCKMLSQIAFVPAEKGMPYVTGALGRKRVLTSYSEAILFKDWPLAWSCTPILSGKSVIPPEFSWKVLQLRSPPPFATVLRHLKIIARNSGEETLARWPTAAGMKSVNEVFADILSYLNNIWGTLSNSDILELKNVPFIPVANATRLVTPNALYARLGLNLAPFAFELPSLYLPYVKILNEMGLQEAPSYESARRLLLQIQNSSAYQHLNPNELRAVLQILKFICEEQKKSIAGGSLQLLPSPSDDAVVPDDGCRLVHARSCIYIDVHGSCILRKIDTSRLRFVNPLLSEQLCEQLGVKKLSDVVVEELDEQQPLKMLEALGLLHHQFIVNKFLNESFQTAVWIVIQKFQEHMSLLKNLTEQEVREVIASAAEKLQFVHCIYTRFLLLPSYLDITLSSSINAKEPTPETEITGMGHQALYFVDRSKRTILVGNPPDAVSVADVLAVVISRLLNSPLCLPIGSLFSVPVGAEIRTLELLQLDSYNKNMAQCFRFSGSKDGLLGQELIASDAMQVQFHPLRPFYSGEIIAWRSGSEEGEKLKYGRVPEDVRPSAGQPLYRFQVEIAPGRTEVLLSSNVRSFKSTVSEISSISDGNIESNIRFDDVEIQEFQSNVRVGMSSNNKSCVESQSKRSSITQAVSTSEIVYAMSDMLSTAGISMDIGQKSLLQQVLSLKEQLAASQASLVLEQERADSSNKEAEMAKTAWSCRVCLNSEIDTLLLPCNHVLCQRCSSAVTRCPFCRCVVTRSLKMYRP